MNVTVDSERCMGHGQCYAHSPEIYEADDDGFAIVLKQPVEGDELQQAIQGAQACPESAITISKESDV